MSTNSWNLIDTVTHDPRYSQSWKCSYRSSPFPCPEKSLRPSLERFLPIFLSFSSSTESTHLAVAASVHASSAHISARRSPIEVWGSVFTCWEKSLLNWGICGRSHKGKKAEYWGKHNLSIAKISRMRQLFLQFHVIIYLSNISQGINIACYYTY